MIIRVLIVEDDQKRADTILFWFPAGPRKRSWSSASCFFEVK